MVRKSCFETRLAANMWSRPTICPMNNHILENRNTIGRYIHKPVLV